MYLDTLVLTVSCCFDYVVDKEGKHYVSHCPALDVYSQGETEEAARDNLKEAVELFLVTCIEIGTLDSVLKECGFEIMDRITTAKAKLSQQRIKVRIPFGSHQPAMACHA